MTVSHADAFRVSRAQENLHVRIAETSTALLCLSHLRWDFVYQRPQHLMSRFAREQPVLYFEEPVDSPRHEDFLEVRQDRSGVRILVPHLVAGRDPSARDAIQRELLDAYLAKSEIE